MKVFVNNSHTWPKQAQHIVIMQGHREPSLLQAGYVVGSPRREGEQLVFDFCNGTELLVAALEDGDYYFPFQMCKESLQQMWAGMAPHPNDGKPIGEVRP